MLSKIINTLQRYTFAFLSCLRLFTIGVFKNSGRTKLSNLCYFFNYARSKEPLQLPVEKISRFVNENIEVKIEDPIGQHGNVELIELMVLSGVVNTIKPKRLFEIGTFDGRTTLNLAINSPDNSEIITIDLPKENIDKSKLNLEKGDYLFIDKNESGSCFTKSSWAPKIEQLYGDTASFDFSNYYQSTDFVFVDASHHHEYVINDSHIAMKLINSNQDKNKMIFWHDYSTNTGVTGALNELYRTNDAYKDLKHIEGTSLVFLAL